MKTSERVAIIYGLSAIGAGAFSYYRGRRGKELLIDTGLHGLVAGTALNVVGFLVLESGDKVPVFAQLNSAKDLGKLTLEGKDLLAKLNSSEIFKDFKANGVKIAEVPEKPSLIKQDAV